MSARVSQGDEVLLVKLGGTSEEFAAQLARVKTLAGKRWNPRDKVWEIPDDDAALLKLVSTVEPDLSPGLLARVRAARQEQASELVTQLPDDGELHVPWADRMAGKQRAGVCFMLETAGAKALLADDMGGGKTVQAITTVYEYIIRASGYGDEPAERDKLEAMPRLVVAPASVLDHWKRELKKWADVPEEKVFIIDASGKEAAVKRAKQLDEAVKTPGAWVLINWEKLQTRVKLVGENSKRKGPLEKVKWLAVIGDESHRMKNHDSQTARGMYKLRAPIQIAASGTPVMNNPGELYSILHWLRPEQYTSFWAFYHSYTEMYKGYQGRDVIIGVKNADGLRFELADKMVRRTKRQIHPDIPEPLDPIIYEPPMSAKQKKIYEETEKDFWLEIAQANDINESTKLELVDKLESDLSVETIKMMIPNAAARTMRLRQVSTSPALLGGDDVSSKLDEAEQIVLSNGLDQPFVWFAWFKDTVDLLVSRFRELGADARGFHGGNTDRPERAAMAAAFQEGEFSIICATIKTGGTGIDLYRAADCGFVEEDWVPGENQQAFDRIDRKGQGFHPQRHILRTPDTVDVGRIAPKLATKQLIVETITGGMK